MLSLMERATGHPSVHVEYVFYGLAVLHLGGEVESCSDPLEHEHLVLGLYLPDGIGIEAVLIEGNLTRCQRAGKGAEQSATGRRDQR
jgi:hypothetical protein